MKRKKYFLRLFALLALMLPWSLQAQNAKVSEYDGSVTTATYTSIASTTTAKTLSGGYADVTMPFQTYFGETNVPSGSTLRVWNDGSVTFPGITALADARIAPLWLSAGYTTSTVYASGNAQLLTVEWRKVVSGDNSYSFQMKLYPGGDIDFCYGPMTISGSINVLVGMMSSTTDIYRVGGTNNGSAWDTIYRNTTGTTTRVLSSSYCPAYNATTGVGQVYSFTQPACVKPTNVTATALAWNSIRVNWKISSPGSGFEVKYSADPAFDPNTGGASKTINNGSDTTTTITVVYGGTPYYIYVRKICSGTPSGWSDMATATTLPGCVDANPPSVTSAGVVSWTSPDELVTSYNIKYGLAGFDPDNEGTAVSNIAALTYTLPMAQLAGATTYDIYLSTNCSASGVTTDWVGPVSFNTPCAAQEVPYFSAMADNYSMPLCWSEDVLAGTDNWSFSSGYASFTYQPDASSRLISPVFNLSTTGDYQVEFDHAEPDYSGVCDSLWLYYRTSSTADWVRLAAYGNHSSSLVHETVLLPNPTPTYQLAFVSYGMDGNSIALANVNVRTQPTCKVPSNLAITGTSGNSVTLTWTENGTATAWQIAYGLFTTDDDYTIVNATTNPFTVTGLGLGDWQFFVRSNCAANDQSDWFGSVSHTFGYCTPTVSSTDGSGLTHVVYGETMIVDNTMSGDQGKFYQNNSSMIGDGFRGATLTVNLTYTTSSYPYGVRVWVDWNQDFDFEDDGEEVYYGSSSFNHTVNIAIPSTVALGDYRMRIGGHDGSAPTTMCGSFTWSSFQDYTIRVIAAPTCFRPNSLVASNVTTTTANLTWVEAGLSTQWEVKYGVSGFDPDEEGTSMMVSNTPTLVLDYLDMGTNYDVYVRSICNPEGPTDWSNAVSFTTASVACLQYGAPGEEQTVTIGDGTSTSNYVPAYSLYDYSFTQQIYTAAELGGSGIINSIAFDIVGVKERNVQIYLVETDKTSFTGGNDWVPVTEANLVYTGSIGASAGWNTITLSTPFSYSGNGSLVVTVNNINGAWSSGMSSHVTTATAKVLRSHRDNDIYSISNLPSGTVDNNRSNLSLGIQYATCLLTPCSAPQVNITLAETEYTATLTFTNANEDVTSPTYGMIWGPQGFNPTTAGTVVSSITNGTYTISGLAAQTAYDVYVYAVCGGNNGDTVRYGFTTPFIPNCKTPVIDGTYGASNIAYNTATLTWRQPGDAPLFWTVRYAPADFNPATSTADQYTELTVTSAQANLTGLVAGTTYYVYIKATCSTSPLDESPWLSMSNANPAYTFTTPACVVPTEVAASDVTNSTAMISWTEAGVATAWTVKYGPAGFDPETEGTAVAATADSIEITGLDAYTNYEAYVKAICTATDESDWSASVAFRTACPDGGSATIGDGTGTTTGVPVANYGSTYCQQIFTADELREAGVNSTIAGLGFNWQAIDASFDKYFSIWLANTDRSSFETVNDFVPYSELTLVYGPVLIEHGTGAGEQEYVFNNAFEWDGTSNIVVVTLMNAGNTDNNASRRAYTHSTGSEYRTMVQRKDGSQYTEEELATITGSTYNGRFTSRANITFIAPCNTDVTCFAPASVSATVADNNTVAVTWAARTNLRPVVNNFELKYGLTGFDPETQGTLVPNLNNVFNYNITGLDPARTYDVNVRTVCGDGNYSKWTKTSFTTNPSCWAPDSLMVTATTSNSATLRWKETTPSAATRWEVVYGLPGFDTNRATPVETTNNSAFVVTGLNHSTKYEFYVRAKCSTTDVSYWSAVATATTQCGTWQYADMPLVENFDGVTGTTSSYINNHVLPNCWSYINTSSTTSGTSTSGYPGYPIAYSGASTSHSGSNHMRFYTYTTTAYGDQFAILPQFGFNLDTMVVGFYAREDATTTSHVGNIEVGVMTDPTDASTFVAVGTVQPTTTTYTYFEVDFIEYTGNASYIALRAPKPTTGYNAVYVDDLTVKLREKINTLSDNGGTVVACNEFVMPDTTGGSYHAGLNTTYIVRPAEAGHVAHITGEFDLEYGYDYLNVYRGAANANNLVARYTGNGTFDHVTASNLWADSGYYTLVLTTDADNAFSYSGFKVLISCECPQPAADIVTETIEANGTYTWRNGTTYNNNIVRTGLTYDAAAAGIADPDLTVTAQHVYTNVAGCDSVTYNLELTIHPTYNLTYDATICQRDELAFYGNTYTATGSYTVNLQSQFGADSTGVLNLQVNPAPTASIYNSGSAVTEINGHCDNADLTLLARSNDNTATFFWDDSSTAASRVVNPHESATYTVVATNPTTGCTSLPATLTVTTTPVPELAIEGDTAICFGQSTTLTLTDANNVEATYRWSTGATATSITVSPTETTTYTVTATTSNASACTATAEITVKVNALPVVTATASVGEICRDSVVTLTATEVEGYSYSWNTGAATAVATTAAASTGVYTVTVTDQKGCVNEFQTSTVTVYPSYEVSDSLMVCYTNNPYTWGEQTLTANGNYDQNFTIAHGCDSLVHLTFTFEELGIENSNREVCEGTSVTWGTETITATESTVLTYVDNSGDCPVQKNLNLVVNYPAATAIEQTVCDSYSWTVSGETYTESGDYPVTLATTKGCDSVVTLNLTVNYRNTGIETVTACDSYVWDLNGVSYTASTTEPTFTLQNQWGCDSVVTLNLTVNYRSYHTDFHCVRDAYDYTWINGNTYDLDVEIADGIEYVTGENADGCNEIAQLHLIMNPAIDTLNWATVEACDEYEIANAVVFNDEDDCDGHIDPLYLRESGDYIVRVRANDGHDQVQRVHLTVNTSNYHTTMAEECLPWTWTIEDEDGNPFEVATITEEMVNGANPFTLSVDMAELGYVTDNCATIEVLRLTPKYPTVVVDTFVTICQNGSWVSENNVVYSGSDYISGTYTYDDSELNEAGCPMSKQVNLTVNPVYYVISNVEFCESDFVLNEESGKYEMTVADANHADAEVVLTIPGALEQEPFTDSIEVSWQTAQGCDSTVKIVYTVNPTLYDDIIAVACYNYEWDLNGHRYSFDDGAEQTDTYTETMDNGCNLVTTLHLTLNDTARGYVDTVVCTSFEYEGTTYRSDKTFAELYKGDNEVTTGCDSVTYIRFHIQQTELIHQYVVSNRPYTWQNGQTFSQSVENIYYDEPMEGDCGNVYSLHLTMVDPITFCDDAFPYATGVNGIQITTNDIVTDEASFCLENPWYSNVGYGNGSEANWGIKFEANRPNDIYEVQGAKLYYRPLTDYNLDVTGDYTLKIFAGGDNVPGSLIATKTVTFDANETEGWKYVALDEPVTVKEQTLWLTFSHVNADGSPNYPSTVVRFFDANDQNGAWTSPDGGTTWQYLNENNPELHYSYMIKAVYSANIWRNNDPNGNDTILYYTVNSTYNTTDVVDVCDSYTWDDSVTYTATGVYTNQYTSAEGCDSVRNLDLTVRTATAATVNLEVCDSYTWPATTGGNDSVYTVSGTHVNTITNEAGCDSVITLNLTVNKNEGVEITVNNGCDSYTWDRTGVEYTESGDYSVTYTDANGCVGDSVLHLTINQSVETNSELVVNDAASYTYLGVMYTAPFDSTITHLFQSVVTGCDSLDHLHIVIPVISDENIIEVAVQACGTYTWEDPDGTGHTYSWIPASERQSHGMALYKDITANKYVYTYPTDTTFVDGVMTQVRVLHLNLLEATYSTETLNVPVSLGSYTINGFDMDGNPDNVTVTFTFDSIGTPIVRTVGVGSVEYCNDYRTFTINVIDNYDTTVVYSCADEASLEWLGETRTLGAPGTIDYFSQKENEGTLNELVHVLKVINRPVNATTVEQTVCDTYTWNEGDGQTYTASGTYVYNYTDNNECAASMTLNLTVNYNSNSAITVDNCDSYTWTAGTGNAYTVSGDYTYSYNAANGCPSTDTLHLTIRNNTNQTITKAECESYTWTAEDGGDGRVLTESGTQTYEYTAENGCPSVNTLNLTINTNTNTSIDVDSCDTYTWTAEDGGNGQVYTTSGVYTYDYNTAAGCPSTNTLNLTIRTSTSSSETLAQCDSYTWTDGDGLAHTESGVYTHTGVNAAGCDSLMTLNLTINVNTNTVNDTMTACDEYTWPLNNRLYNSTGNYTFRTSDENGCNTTNTLTLTINQSTSYDSTLYVSDGSYRYIYQDNHQELFGEGVYPLTEHYTNANGCDSTLNITLHVGTVQLGVDNVVSCNSYTWRNGETYVWISAEERAANLNADNDAPLYKTSTGTYVYYNPTFTVAQQNNYDSIYMLALTLTQSAIATDEVTINISDRVVTYGDSIFYFDTLADLQQEFVSTDKEFEVHFPAVQHCDSIIILTVHLLSNYEEVVADNADICVTTTSFEWRNHTVSTATNDYDHAHTYYIYDTLASGTIEYITVNQHPVTYATERRTACDEYTWNGTTYTESTSNATAYFPAGTVFNAGTDEEYTLVCDSTVTLMLTINHNTSTEYTVEECNSYIWTAANGGDGETYTESGDYEYDYLTDKGCPSTNTLHLTINLPTSTEYTVDVCDSYTWTVEEGGDGRELTASGEYTYSYNTAAGCASVNTLNLTIRTNSNEAVTKSVCDTYTWTAADKGNDTTYTESGVYYYEYEAENGCPSVNTLNLTVNKNSGHTDVIAACDSYTWHGTEYTADNNTATYSYVDGNNCPSVDTLDLTVSYSTHNSESVVACQTYTWHGVTYDNPSTVGDLFYGDYEYYYTNEQGCASVDTLHLTLGGGRTFNTQTVTNCGPYTWIVNGEEVGVLDESMETSTSFSNPRTGCDSVIFLNLTILEAPETVVNVAVCDNELPYTWTDGDNSTVLNEAGEATVTYPFSATCDSTVRLVLTVNPTMVTNLTDQICLGNDYTANGFNIAADELATAGVYEFVDHRTTETGCEHTYNLTLTVGDIIDNPVEEVACDSYVWNAGDGQSYTFTTSGTYSSEPYANEMGCTTVDVLTLTINQNAGSVDNVARCFSYVWNGNEYTESGDYYYEYVDGNGCASVDTLHLTVNQNTSTGEVVNTCYAYTWHDVRYTQSGTFYHHYTTEEGCASIDTLYLTIGGMSATFMTETACDSYTWETNGETYTTGGTYLWSTPSANGCDSIVTLTLTINSYEPTVEAVTACDSYEWNGTDYTTSGTYTYLNTGANGCSGNDTLVLTINSYEPTVEAVTACDSYTWNGTEYTTSGIYTAINSDNNGCSGNDTLNLTIKNSATGSFEAITCNTYTWNGTTYNASGVYSQTLQTADGCDSVVTMTLTVSPAASINIYKTTCGSYTWDDDTYTASGIYTHSYTTASGCDSIVNLMLTINAAITNTVTTTACDSYTWIDGQTYTASTNTPSVTLTAANGCDSIVTLNLTVNNSVNTTFAATACNSYTWNGATYSATGAYTQNYQTVNGCDSIVTLNLTIAPAITTTITTTQCNSYIWEGTTYTTSGVYSHTYTAANGCDSIVTLILTIKNDVTSNVTATACDSYTWNNLAYTTSGNYTHTYTAANGCDSIVTLNLTVNNSASSSFSETVCASYTWNGATYTTSGAYTHTYTTVGGCDSVVTLNLTISPAITTTVSEQACGSYTWNGITYSVSGVYTYTYTAAGGCDSIVTLNLTILPAINSTVAETACDSYTWNGTTYTTSGIYYNSFTTADGCDSNVTMMLTITNSITNTVAETACDSYTWNGTEYTTSGAYTATFTSVGECDSIVTLNLTINASNAATDSLVACESYTWIDGETYTASTNTPTVTLTNAAGCDSVVTLKLTVNHVTYGIDEQVACDGFIWIDGNNYTESTTTPVDTITGRNGCDSIVTLHLTINKSVEVYDTITVNSTDLPYTWREQTIPAAGDYTFNAYTVNGCDSTVYLHVNVNQIGIDIVSSLDDLKVYPNPTRGQVTISAEDVVKVEVLDIVGRLVATFKDTNTFDLSNLAEGAYTLRITLPEGVTVRKVVKK